MKALAALEKNKTSWFILIVLFSFFLLRLPSLFEPLWYGDEGIYQVIGTALHHGRFLYKDIWDNKPPFLYLLYALFNSDQFAIRLVSLVFGLLSVVVFFLIVKKLFPLQTSKQKIYFFTTSIFALLFALPLIEGNIANAENFMLLPILISALLILNSTQSSIHTRTYKDTLSSFRFQIFVAGLLLSIAFLFKVVAMFDLAAFFVFLLFYNLESVSKRHSGLSRISHRLEQKGFWMRFAYQNDEKRKLFLLLLGFLIPIAITALFFLIHGAFKDFLQATFVQNVGYVGYGNKFLIPHGLLLLKGIFLYIFMIYIFRRREIISPTTIFILIWFSFSLFNAFFSERPYPHYLLVLLPSFSLMLGLIAWDKKYQKPIFIFFIVSLILILRNFHFYGKSITYYKNFALFLAGQKSVSSYQAFFDKKTPIDYEIALWIKSKVDKKNSIFIWGNNAQVYNLVGVLPPGKYIVAYHITSYKNSLIDTEESIKKAKPKFIVIMPDQEPIPLSLSHYSERIKIDSATIYERIF